MLKATIANESANNGKVIEKALLWMTLITSVKLADLESDNQQPGAWASQNEVGQSCQLCSYNAE